MRGPMSKPTKLKLLEGRSPGRDSGGRPIRLEDEPQPVLGNSEGEPEPPEWLDRRQLAIWDEMIETLRPTGILSLADRYQLATYCVLVARLSVKGADLPASYIAQIRFLSAMFGLSPADRARFGNIARKTREQGDVDPIDRIRQRGRR